MLSNLNSMFAYSLLFLSILHQEENKKKSEIV